MSMPSGEGSTPRENLSVVVLVELLFNLTRFSKLSGEEGTVPPLPLPRVPEDEISDTISPVPEELELTESGKGFPSGLKPLPEDDSPDSTVESVPRALAIGSAGSSGGCAVPAVLVV